MKKLWKWIAGVGIWISLCLVCYYKTLHSEYLFDQIRYFLLFMVFIGAGIGLIIAPVLSQALNLIVEREIARAIIKQFKKREK